jgi:WD40 repeat protein
VLFLSLPEGRLVSYSTELGDRVHQERVRCCCFTPMGKSLISADKEGKIIIWDSESEPSTRGIASYDAHAGEISAMAISPDGKFLATAGSDNLVKIWDLDLIIESHPLERDNHEEAVYCCMYSSDGATAYTGSVQRMVRSSALYRWKTESGFPSLDQRMPTSLGIYEISSMAMLPSFGLLAYIKTIESSLVLCDPTSGSLIQQMNIPYECKVLQLIPATEHLLLLRPYRSLGRPYGSYSDNIRSREGESGDVFLFDPAKKSLDVFLTADGVKRSCMCISRDSSLLVFGTEDSELELWDLSGKCRLDVVSIGESPVRSCSVAPDGRTIVVGLLDGSIGVLDYLPGGQAAAPNLVKAHDGPVNWCGFMRTRHLLITCGVDKTVLAWKWPGPRALARYICSGAIWSAAIHPQRNELLVGDIGGQCYFLALEAGQGSRRQRHSIKR